MSTGCSYVQQASQTTKPATLQELVTGENWEFKVTSASRTLQVETCLSVSITNAQECRFAPPSLKAKGIYEVLQLTFKNIGKRNFGLGLQDFELSTKGGVVYDADISATSAYVTSYARISSDQRYVELSSLGQYPPALEFKTTLVFDVHPNAADLDLVLLQAGKRRVIIR
jgi:hypothetical protein